MRIIAGEARGRTIVAPKGQDTRPTQDYVRESLFNILRLDVPDAKVLDLFAGSGALALEAVSRGAASAVCVDCAPDAITCIRRNIETLHMNERVTVMRADWQPALDRLARENAAFTLVFLDPPYRMGDLGALCRQLAEHGLLAPDALLVVEHSRNFPPTPGTAFIQRDTRRYGDTEIHFFTYQGGENNRA